jgi:RimJ/RimL family protein N-acetyltransferase
VAKYEGFTRNIDPLNAPLPEPGSYALLHPETGALCGFAPIGPINRRARIVEVGAAVWQHKEFIPLWWECALAHLFNVLCYNRITSTPLASHVSAHKHLENAGFRHESTFRQSAYVGGKHVDEVQYVILKEEYAHCNDGPDGHAKEARE